MSIVTYTTEGHEHVAFAEDNRELAATIAELREAGVEDYEIEDADL